MKNKIEDLRDHLFETLESLRDKEKPMDIDRARAIADVARVVVDSAKAENDFIRLTGSKGSGFIPKALPPGDVAETPAPVEQPRLLKPGKNGSAGKGRCPDPNCGGWLTPSTNGNGGLRDVCDKCHRSVTPAVA